MVATAMKARLHLATMHDACWRWGDEVETTYTDWHQVSGDLAASTFGATFARVCNETRAISDVPRKSLEMVRIFNWEVDVDEPAGEDGPYMVESRTIEPWNLTPDTRAIFNRVLLERELDETVDADTLLLMIGQEIVNYWGYEGEAYVSYPTLAAAMNSCSIPQAALWEPQEYNRRSGWGVACKHVSDASAFPRDNHAAVVAKAITEELENFDGVDAMGRLHELHNHLAGIIRRIDRAGDPVPEWYGNGVPRSEWADLPTF